MLQLARNPVSEDTREASALFPFMGMTDLRLRKYRQNATVSYLNNKHLSQTFNCSIIVLKAIYVITARRNEIDGERGPPLLFFKSMQINKSDNF